MAEAQKAEIAAILQGLTQTPNRFPVLSSRHWNYPSNDRGSVERLKGSQNYIIRYSRGWPLCSILHSSIILFSSIRILPIRPSMAILQNHLINNFSAKNTSPPHKVLMGSIESFADHHTATTMTLHRKLLDSIFYLNFDLYDLMTQLSNLFHQPDFWSSTASSHNTTGDELELLTEHSF